MKQTVADNNPYDRPKYDKWEAHQRSREKVYKAWHACITAASMRSPDFEERRKELKAALNNRLAILMTL